MIRSREGSKYTPPPPPPLSPHTGALSERAGSRRKGGAPGLLTLPCSPAMLGDGQQERRGEFLSDVGGKLGSSGACERAAWTRAEAVAEAAGRCEDAKQQLPWQPFCFASFFPPQGRQGQGGRRGRGRKGGSGEERELRGEAEGTGSQQKGHGTVCLTLGLLPPMRRP